MNDTSAGMTEHSMHNAIFLAEQRLVMLALLHVVNLHTVVTFGRKKKAAFIIKI